MEIKFSDYKTVQEAATEWGVTTHMVILYCTSGRLPGTVKAAGRWLIPRETEKPEDSRKNNRRQPKKENKS
jgi:predicted site-specific integrase-resolvase